MNTSRIADLLEPFLRAPVAITGNVSLTHGGHSKALHSCHSEPAKAGGEPAVLSPAQLLSISTYIDILVRWNTRINLTAIRDPEDIVTRHFGESFFAARNLYPVSSSVSSVPPVVRDFEPAVTLGEFYPVSPVFRDFEFADSVADLGSGAGFPGLPIKLWAPHISLTLIESNHKKAAFLREVTRALTLTGVNIQNARAESITETFDVVTLRAVERFESILPIAAALLAPVGRLALLISSAQQDQARSTLPNLTWSNPTPVPHSRSRIVLVGSLT